MTKNKEVDDPSSPSDSSVHNNAPIGQQIINQGTAHFHLGGAPLDWPTLARQTATWCEDTRNTIGSDLQLERPDLDRELSEALNEHRVVPVLGNSGSGKSALVKKLILSGIVTCPVYCLYADELARLDALLAATGSSLADFIAGSPSDESLLVIDGAERLLGGSMLIAARAIRALGLSKPESKWRLVLTCQLTAWEEVRRGLREQQADLGPVKPITISPLEDAQLKAVRERFPPLTPLLTRRELRPLIAQVKVLDLLASAIADGDLPITERWVGESNVIEWFWETRLRSGGRGDEHAALLQRIARDQADRREFKTLIVDLSGKISETVLNELKALGLIIRHEETIRFSHDLYADQARQRFLLSMFRVGRMDEIQLRESNPHWHRAIRLLALHLLETGGEKGTSDISAWWRLIQVLGRESLEGAAVDLALEASVFAAEPGPLLDQMASHLFATDGSLLRRLLFRFFYATSLPREDLMENLRDLSPVVRAHFEARYRLPNIWLWVPVISWIVERRRDILKYAPNEFMKIADPWLQIGRHHPSLSEVREIGAMVLTLAEQETPRWRRYDETEIRIADRKELFKLALLCGAIQRDRLDALILRLSGRVVNPDDRKAMLPRPLMAHQRIRYGDATEPPPPPTPWPRGPIAKPDGDFQEVALTRPGAALLLELGVEFARDTFWALLIEPPREDLGWGYSSTSVELRCGLQEPKEARPPFYNFAPAALLLEKHPEVGLDFIVRLVDFATEQWVRNWRHWEAGLPSDAPRLFGSDTTVPRNDVVLVVAGVERSYLGDGRAFEWHRGGSQGGVVAASVLMVLEHWLYEQDDKDPPNTAALDTLLQSSRSVAVLGVLFDVALRNPALLLGPLEPLVTAPEIYYWSRIRPSRVRADTALGEWFRQDEETKKKAVEWHQLAHRKLEFADVVAQIFAFKKTQWEALERARQRWMILRDSSHSERAKEWLGILIFDFDRTSWRLTPTVDGQQVAVEFVPPAKADTNASEVEGLEERAKFQYFPIRCRKILDGEETVTDSELVEILSYVDKTHELNAEELFLTGGVRGIQCAAAAVAVVRFPDWLERHPEWDERIRRWILAASASQEQSDVLGPEHGLGSLTWDAFCADSLPSLWAKKPDDPALRKAVAALLMAPHEDAVKRVFAAVATRRGALTTEFWRLLHLGFKIARIMKIVRNSHPQSGVDVRARRLIQRAMDAFVNRTLDPLPVSWSSLATEIPDGLRVRGPTARWQGSPGFAENYFLFCLQWLGVTVRNPAEADRAAIIALLEGIMTVMLQPVERPRRKRQTIKIPPVPDTRVFVPASLESIVRDLAVRQNATRRGGLGSVLKRGLAAIHAGFEAAWSSLTGSTDPTDTTDDEEDGPADEERFWELDRDVAAWCAGLVVCEPDGHVRRRISERWLNLPSQGDKWVEGFLREVYRQGMDRKEVAPHFHEALCEVFDSGLKSFSGPSRDGYPYRDRDVLCALIGVDGWTPVESRWKDDREPLARLLRTRWQRWASVALTTRGCAERFIALLRSPAAKSIRVDALGWLKESDVKAWLEERSAADALFGLLEVVRVEHEVALISNESARSSFEALLHALVGIQHAPSILLAQKLSSSA